MSTQVAFAATARHKRYITRGKNQLHTIFEKHFSEFCDQYDERFARNTEDRPAAPLPVERPLQLRGGAQRQRSVAQPLPRVRLIGAQPHGADAPSGCCVAEAELAHSVVEQAGEASLQIQPARLDLDKWSMTAPCRCRSWRTSVPGLPQQLAVGEGADGGGDRGRVAVVRCAVIMP